MKDEFPESQLMVRAEAALSIYLVSDGVKDILFNCKDGLRRVLLASLLASHAPVAHTMITFSFARPSTPAWQCSRSTPRPTSAAATAPAKRCASTTLGRNCSFDVTIR